jgi:hypothetical protein
MGSGNGSNVRTMRTRFPPGRKAGEPQQENRLGLGGRSQGALGFSGEGVERVFVGWGPKRVLRFPLAGKWFRGGPRSRWRRCLHAGKGVVAGRAALPFAVLSLQDSRAWARLCPSPGFLSRFATLTVAHPGGKFPSRRSGSKAERSRQGCFTTALYP